MAVISDSYFSLDTCSDHSIALVDHHEYAFPVTPGGTGHQCDVVVLGAAYPSYEEARDAFDAYVRSDFWTIRKSLEAAGKAYLVFSPTAHLRVERTWAFHEGNVVVLLNAKLPPRPSVDQAVKRHEQCPPTSDYVACLTEIVATVKLTPSVTRRSVPPPRRRRAT